MSDEREDADASEEPTAAPEAKPKPKPEAPATPRPEALPEYSEAMEPHLISITSAAPGTRAWFLKGTQKEPEMDAQKVLLWGLNFSGVARPMCMEPDGSVALADEFDGLLFAITNGPGQPDSAAMQAAIGSLPKG